MSENIACHLVDQYLHKHSPVDWIHLMLKPVKDSADSVRVRYLLTVYKLGDFRTSPVLLTVYILGDFRTSSVFINNI